MVDEVVHFQAGSIPINSKKNSELHESRGYSYLQGTSTDGCNQLVAQIREGAQREFVESCSNWT